MGYLDYAGLQYLWGKLKEKFAPKSHSHDDRYYTESEMDGKLNSKVNNNEAGANGLLSKLSVWTATPTDDTYFMRQDTGGGNSFGRVKFSTIWSYIKGKADGVYQPKGSYAASGHAHDDRYYTEAEMNTKLAGKSNTDHTHKNVNDIGSNKPTTFAYSKDGMNYGDYSWLAGWNGYELRAVNKNQFAITDHAHPTSEIYGGNVNYSGYAGPIESAHIDVLRANRLAFLPASGVKVEYSVDGGTTWVDYGANDAQKASLFAMRMGSAASFYTGKHTKADECTTKDQLRVTVTPVDRYASVNMLYLWVSVAGTSATVNISRSTIGAKETFTDVRTDVPISGWSGPNEIRFSGGTFGGGSTQTSNAYAYRFTFKNKADGKGSVSVMDIRMYGPSAWGVPNSMMEKDHIYNWDINQNVQFPAQVTATKFNGSSTGVVDYGDSNGSTIKVGFGGAGLTKDKLTHIAGYAKDGNQTVIKDVDRGVLQSWINLNEMINTQLTTGSSTPSDNDFYISQYAGGGATTTTYHRRPVSALWSYIKSKADAVYSAKSHTHTKSQITDFPASLKNPTALTIQTNGTTAAIYDGSAAKTVNVTKGNIGLGNVDNTADANKSVKYATSAGSANTATKATTADSATTATTSKSLQLLSSDRPTSMNFNLSSADYNQKVTYTIASASTKEGKPPRDSLVTTYAWDNSGWGAQLAIDADSNPRMYVRGATNNNGASKWDANWKTIAYSDDAMTPKPHTHNYAGSSSAGGSANSAVKLDSSAGSNNQPVYFSGGKPVAIGYTIAKSVPADAKFTDTNTWRGIQNNLTSDSTDQSLSAAQGKALKTLVDGKAPTSHTHTKSQITDFPSSMPASDVSAWAKAATKPSYTKAEVGLSNVDNTADKNKNVKFATSAGSATNAQCLNNDSQYMRFHWNGQSGQPSWLWGGSDASNMYVYNPSNFSVNYANSAGTTLDAPYTITYEGTYTGTGEYTGSASLPIRHTLSKSYDLVYFIKNLKGRYTPGLINLFSQGNYGKQYVAMNMLPTTFTLITDLSPNKITMYNGGSNTSTSGQWANRNYIRRNGNSIEFYSTYSSNNADYFFNDKYTSYYIFGFNLNHSLFHYDV